MKRNDTIELLVKLHFRLGQIKQALEMNEQIPVWEMSDPMTAAEKLGELKSNENELKFIREMIEFIALKTNIGISFSRVEEIHYDN